MAVSNRPLSPHLQIYKPQLTSVLSITHRGTGIFLGIGFLLLPCWLLAVAGGAEAYGNWLTHLNAWYGKIMLYAWVFALYYHLCNGIRHLGWDLGLGLDLKTTYATGYIMLAASLILTLVTLL